MRKLLFLMLLTSCTRQTPERAAEKFMDICNKNKVRAGVFFDKNDSTIVKRNF